MGDAGDESAEISCRKQLEFSTGSSSGLGSSLNTTSLNNTTDHSHGTTGVNGEGDTVPEASVAEVTSGVSTSISTELSSDTTGEEGSNECDKAVSEIESIDTQYSSSRDVASQLSVVAPTVPASTSMLTNASAGKICTVSLTYLFL